MWRPWGAEVEPNEAFPGAMVSSTCVNVREVDLLIIAPLKHQTAAGNLSAKVDNSPYVVPRLLLEYLLLLRHLLKFVSETIELALILIQTQVLEKRPAPLANDSCLSFIVTDSHPCLKDTFQGWVGQGSGSFTTNHACFAWVETEPCDNVPLIL